MVKLLRRSWSLVVVVLEGKMHWAMARIGWGGRRERMMVVVIVVVMVVMVDDSSTGSTILIPMFIIEVLGVIILCVTIRVGGFRA